MSARCQPPLSDGISLLIHISDLEQWEPLQTPLTDNPLNAKVTCLRCVEGECQLKRNRHDGPGRKKTKKVVFLFVRLTGL